MEYSANKVVELAQSWVGLNVHDGSYKKIIDTYNTHKPLPRGIKMQYGWAWCACTWSALAIKLGYTEIMPVEISCGNLLELAKKMGIWQENDHYIPSPGDAILYDWEDKGTSDDTGWPDHVGMIESVNRKEGYFTVIEGNYSKSVKRRTVSINGKYIRGFITPRYTQPFEQNSVKETNNKSVSTIAHEVIAGKWGNGENRKKKLEAAGYNYDEIQKVVNEILNNPSEKNATSKEVISTCVPKYYHKDYVGPFVTTADLYCRNDAGTNKKALCAIPKGTEVQCMGRYSKINSCDWLFIDFWLNGTYYAGFSSSVYLKEAI